MHNEPAPQDRILKLDDRLTHARILVVDDEPANVLLLTQLLWETGYERLQFTTDSSQVMPLYQDFAPDLILLDLRMPDPDGFALLDQLHTVIAKDDYLPILVLTADITPDAKRRALTMGATDFLSKPFDIYEVLLRIRNLLEARLLHLELQQKNQQLDQQVRERTHELEAAHADLLERNRDLEAAQREIVERLGYASEYRDDVTGEHVQRVRGLATCLAEALGVSATEVALINQAAALHDVGKIGIPDQILLKPGPLTGEERQQMQGHSDIGGRILGGSRLRLLQVAEEIALTHHERWDGLGYPLGLVGEAIPLSGRIVAVCDVFDALTSERPYKRAWSVEDALTEIARQSGLQFDPRVVAAFLSIELAPCLDLYAALPSAGPGVPRTQERAPAPMTSAQAAAILA